MSTKVQTRHFHAGKQRKTFDGVEFVGEYKWEVLHG